MAPNASKAAGSPPGEGVNQVLARGKLLARIRKEKAAAEERGETYQYPAETPLLEDGSSDMTLGDLMSQEGISLKKAVKVMLKFRSDAATAAKAAGDLNPKAAACLPEDVCPSASSKPAAKPKPSSQLKIAAGKKVAQAEKGDAVPNEELEVEPATAKKARSKAAPLDADASGKPDPGTSGKSKKAKRAHEPTDHQQAKATAEATAEATSEATAEATAEAGSEQKKPKKQKANEPTEDAQDTLVDTAVDEPPCAAASPKKTKKKRERETVPEKADKSKKKEKKEKKDQIPTRDEELLEMIQEIEQQVTESEPTLEALVSLADVKPATRVSSKRPPMSASAPPKPSTAEPERQEPGPSTAEASGLSSKLLRASSQDRQPDPTESDLDTQHKAWSLGLQCACVYN